MLCEQLERERERDTHTHTRCEPLLFFILSYLRKLSVPFLCRRGFCQDEQEMITKIE